MTIYLVSDAGLVSKCEDRAMANFLLIRLPGLKEVSEESYWQERSELRLVGKNRARRAIARATSTRLAIAAKASGYARRKDQ